MPCYADLHLHSTASDGMYTPAELSEQLTQKGVLVAALTDHDTINGFEEFQSHFSGISIIGVELSILYDRLDFHVLGYGFDPNNDVLKERLQYYQEVRAERLNKIIVHLQALGFPLHQHDVEEEVSHSLSAGRLHIARAMIKRGWVGSIKEAFDKYLGYDKPAYVPKAKMSFEEALTLIHQAQGIAVLAHPGKTFPKILTPLVTHSDLDGIESWHPAHTLEMRKKLETIAKKHGKILTGGSDFHGNEAMSLSPGDFGIDIEHWMIVKRYLKERQTFIAPYL